MKQISEKVSLGLPSAAGLGARARLVNITSSLSRLLDKLAAAAVVSIMLLVVVNVLMRTLFKKPILGTYEYVGFLTAVAVGLALAHCAVKDGHIAVDFIMDRFPTRVQQLAAMLIHSVGVVFFIGAAWSLMVYAADSKTDGLVSATTQTPVYPFIYVVALGFCVLALVQVSKLVNVLNYGVDNE